MHITILPYLHKLLLHVKGLDFNACWFDKSQAVRTKSEYPLPLVFKVRGRQQSSQTLHVGESK